MKQNARKDPGAGGGAFVIACVDIKLFVVSLAFLTLLLGLWQLQPYGSFMAAARTSASAPPCFLLSTTVAASNNEVTSSNSVYIKGTVTSTPAATSDVPANIATVPARLVRPARVEDPSKRVVRPARAEEPNKWVLKPAPAEDPNKRALRPYGSAAALFVQFGAYRGGPRTFAIVGLASKPTHVFGTPYFKCEWLPNPSAADPAPRPVRTKAYKMLPDWGYGRVYTTVVVNCTFPSNPNVDNAGGKLLVHAYYSIHSRRYERFVALEEAPGSYDESRFSPPFKYDYLYCGSSLYGNLSASRMREWMAYHAHFFGPRSHFVFHDASGFSPEVKAVLDPWVRAGRLTVQDVRAEAEYDSYYYNQFLVVNDCLHRYRHAANWTFFFDVDEYIYLPNEQTLDQVLGKLSGYTQLTIKQNPMSSKLCLKNPSKDSSREWGFEKFVFFNAVVKPRRDRKYAVQARNTYSAGVHLSQNLYGRSAQDTENVIRYYHFHNSINVLGEPCQKFVPKPANGSQIMFEGAPYVYDDNLKRLAGEIKRFEKETIGSRHT